MKSRLDDLSIAQDVCRLVVPVAPGFQQDDRKPGSTETQRHGDACRSSPNDANIRLKPFSDRRKGSIIDHRPMPDPAVRPPGK